VDLDPAALAAHEGRAYPGLTVRWVQGDFLDLADGIELTRDFDLVVGNPPFSDVEPGKKRGPVVAHQHIDAARGLARYVCMISRVGLITTSEKRPWGILNPCVHELRPWPRPPFLAKGTDSCEYQAGIWAGLALRQVGPSRPTTSEILDWKGLLAEVNSAA
jgi:hypothetical protein